MRSLQHLVLFFLFLCCAGLVIWLWGYFSKADSVEKVVGGEGYSRSITYGFTGQEWLEIPFPNTSEIKVITTAVLRPVEDVDENSNWGYIMEYQLLDRGSRVLKQWQYHYRTGIRKYRDPESGMLKWKTILVDMPGIATYSRSTIVPVEHYKAARKLKVRVHQLHPELETMLVRAYVKEKSDEKKAALRWKRFDSEKKEKLAKVSVLGSEFLRKQEIENLLTYRWVPVGPAGVEGEDYQIHILLAEDADFDSFGEEEQLPQGIYVNSRRRGILPLPEEPFSIGVETIVFDGGHGARSPGIDIFYQGRNAEQHWFFGPDSGSSLYHDLGTMTGGTLEFVSQGPVVVRVYAQEEKNKRLLPPEPVRVRSYLLAENRGVDYAVEHVGSHATPFRIDVRALYELADSEHKGNVQYELIDGNGVVLTQGNIVFAQPFSLYDYVSSDRNVGVSEVERRYFELAENVSRIRLRSSFPVLISAYTRPFDLRRLVRVPEDYLLLQQDQLRVPSWFGVRPLGHRSFFDQGYTMDLMVNPRPAQQDSDITEGNYAVTGYEPLEKGVNKELLVPRLFSSLIPERSRAGIFSLLKSSAVTEVRLIGQRGRQQVAPKLIYLTEKDGPHDVEIAVDGKPVVQTRLFSSRGMIKLPLLPVGFHDFLIRADKEIKWWLNYSGAGSESMLVKRVHKLSSSPLHYRYKKESAGDETLTGSLHCVNEGRETLLVNISRPASEANVPQKAMSFYNRVFAVHSRPPQNIPVLDDPSQWLNSEQKFYIPLAEDVPEGEYSIGLEYRGENECYLFMSQLLPGLPTVRNYYREGDLRVLEGEQ